MEARGGATASCEGGDSDVRVQRRRRRGKRAVGRSGEKERSGSWAAAQFLVFFSSVDNFPF